MPDAPTFLSDSALEAEIRAVHAFYQALAPKLDPVSALGGKFIFAGELSAESTHLLRAANIAGGASLTVSSAPDELRKAMRNGVVDFLVTSLDEALRILKNELRKRLPVAVGVEGNPAKIGNEMMIRGVQPDLLIPIAGAIVPLCARAAFLERGAQLVEPGGPAQDGKELRIWPVPAAWKMRMAELEARLAELLPADAYTERRWLRLSPRYLGAQARRLRSVACSDEQAATLATILA
jgi:hypothetical protein